MLKKFVHIVFVLLLAIKVSGQTPSIAGAGSSVTQNPGLYEIIEKVRYHGKRKRVAKGTPFVTEGWLKGEIETTDNRIFKNLALKFNLLTGQVLYKNPRSRDSSYIKTEFLRKFSIYDESKDSLMIFQKFLSPIKIKPKPSMNFYQILYKDAKVSLLQYSQKNLLKYDPKSMANNTGALSDEYVLIQEFFIRKADKTIWKIKKRGKNISSILHEESDSVLDYIRTQKLNLKKEHDLVKVLQYYETL